jgi:predicted RNA-binding protein associated with RNAse of E/G family
MPQIEIRYHRPPARLDVFFQDLVVDEPDLKVTLHDPSTIGNAITIGDQAVFEPEAPIVWFVFPGGWYDIGRFHLKDGTFTGYYVNLIAPPQLDGNVWTMYDLCLDLWLDANGQFRILDQDEFDEAVDRGWIDSVTAHRARDEMNRVIDRISDGAWPPEVVAGYDLERVRVLRAQSITGNL